ncbi:alcohol oxidase [Dichomitus squalens LYAD-421 SS1]|uniref:Alcohol oxidase n=1 Tax=Dichomitus squalens (strain LYAD-421) TaxID=732165 RepID=R7SVW7_DICSQ|nr:alcohol oxidase [Dichomitus squalens LYAD-421 SS1]EJF60344.1 alcohol oxidase [Dichomitus squalens LYAD-421 SS1]
MVVYPVRTPEEVGTTVPVDPKVPAETYTYDYIVVGGGTAGCVLASRLSEDPDTSVLLIEQGPVADTWASRVPTISSNLFAKDSLAAHWWSTPMPHADNRSLGVMRGEALGGTTRINSMLYTRGTPGDYNQWKLLGNDGWGYDDVEPYFVKSERTHSLPASKYRGKAGPWQNQQFPISQYKAVPYVHRALQKVGIERHPDLNSPSMPAAGTGTLDVTEDKQYHRHSVDRAFLPAKLAHERRTRLKICTATIVTRVVLAEEGDEVRATGVHLETTNARKAWKRYLATARREVVLCGGALGSPHLLMLSGLGPKEHLESKSIRVVRDLPAVGSYLQDHIGVPLTFEVPIEDSLHILEVSPARVVKELLKYLITGRGALSHPFQTASTFIPSRLLDDKSTVSVKDSSDLDASIPANRPDIEFMYIGNNCTDTDIPRTGLFTLLSANIRPKSMGSVRLASSNPRVRPEVDLGYFTHPEDYVPLRKAIRLAQRVAGDVREQGYPLKDFIVPDDSSDEVLDAYIRANLRTCLHYTSTCRMGATTHAERPSVVDTELRVHGVKGLRVCDASVFPEIVGAHTMAPTVMVAEKCADLIKASK